MSQPPPMRGIGRQKRDEHGILFGDHRCTPEVIWKAALAAIGAARFDLDPATNPQATVPAATKWMGPLDGNDGLELAWFGNVWLNFPFSKPPPWIAKVQDEAHRCRSITVLGPNDSSVDWWQEMLQFADAHASWPRRVHFPLPGRPKGSPPAPIALWYVGPQSNAWRRVMLAHGCTVTAGHIDRPRTIRLNGRKKKPRSLG